MDEKKISKKKEQERSAVARLQAADTLNQGRDRHFMTLDSWNQDGNYQARKDEFGPDLEQEAPPTLNGQPLEP